MGSVLFDMKRIFIFIIILVLCLIHESYAKCISINDLLGQIESSLKQKNKEEFLQLFSANERISGAEKEKFVKSYVEDFPYAEAYLVYSTQGITDAANVVSLTVIFLRGSECVIENWEVYIEKNQDAYVISNIIVRNVISRIQRLKLMLEKAYKATNIEFSFPDGKAAFRSAYLFKENENKKGSMFIVIGQGIFTFAPSVDYEKNQMNLLTGKDYMEDTLESFVVMTKPKSLNALFKYESMETIIPDKDLKNKVQKIWMREQNKQLQMDWLKNIDKDALWNFVIEGDSMKLALDLKKYGELSYGFFPDMPYPIQLQKDNPKEIYAFYNPLQAKSEAVSFNLVRPYVVQNQHLQIKVNVQNKMISGRARLTLKSFVDNLKNVEFFLNKNLAIESIVDEDSRSLLYFQNQSEQLVTVFLKKGIRKDGEQSIEIAYAGIVQPARPSQDYIRIVKFESDQQEEEEEQYFIQQHYFYEGTLNWYPQTTLPEFSTGKLEVTVPQGFQVIASGRPLETKNQQNNATFNFDADVPIKHFSFLIFKDSHITALTQDNIRFYLEQNSPEKELKEKASKILRFYESILGMNPYPTLAIYHHFDDYQGGYGQAGFIILVSKHPLISKKRIKVGHPLYIQQYDDFYLAHEIAHLWWGQALAWLTYQDQWLSEGIAHYMAAQYIKDAYGENAYDAILEKFSSSVKAEAKAGPIILGRRIGLLTKDADAFGAIVYNKSAITLIMLEEIIGEKTFLSALKSFFSKYQFTFVTTSDFIQSMQENCKCDLGIFFLNWYFLSEIPNVFIEKKITDNSVQLFIKMSPEGILPLEIEFKYEDGTAEKIKLILTKMNQKFTFETRKRLKKINVKDIYPMILQ